MPVKQTSNFEIIKIIKAKSRPFNQLQFIINTFYHPIGSPVVKIGNYLIKPPQHRVLTFGIILPS
jgi:hypothetical protein